MELEAERRAFLAEQQRLLDEQEQLRRDIEARQRAIEQRQQRRMSDLQEKQEEQRRLSEARQWPDAHERGDGRVAKNKPKAAQYKPKHTGKQSQSAPNKKVPAAVARRQISRSGIAAAAGAMSHYPVLPAIPHTCACPATAPTDLVQGRSRSAVQDRRVV